MFIYIDTYIQLTGFTCITPTQFYYTGTAARGRCRGVTGPEVKKKVSCASTGKVQKSLPPQTFSEEKVFRRKHSVARDAQHEMSVCNNLCAHQAFLRGI